MFPYLCAGIVVLLSAISAFWFYRQLRKRGLHRCAINYLRGMPKRRAVRFDRETHVLLCFCDHYEPKWGNPSAAQALRRVQTWVRQFPKQFADFRDSDGRPPRWTFFYPAEEYETEYLNLLTELCRAGYGEVEIHLHHHRDTAENLRKSLSAYRDLLSTRHQLLAADRRGAVRYGFIHGDWALCNGVGNGACCGVDDELDILRETGCYADFTMPSAPHRAQTSTINSIYYARTIPGRSRSHDFGTPVGVGPVPADSLLLIQGPLLLEWRKGRFFPGLENGCLQGSQPPTFKRLRNWLRAGVQAPTRPDWYFVKLHMHGAPEDAHEALLGAPMVQFHQDLARFAADHERFHYHYVTAREMYNLVKAAEARWSGSVAEARDFELVWRGKTA